MLKIVGNYTLTQYINQGQYGKVYKAINHETSEYVAVKAISLDKFMQRSKLIELTRQQIQLLSKLECNQNIIKFKQIIKSNRYLYLVYEYCNGNTLQQYLRKRGRLSQNQATRVLKQIVSGYRSLYENCIIHRDIKTDNILFKDGIVKLADFGFSKKLKFPDDLTQTSLGSPLYMAPEVLNNEIYGTKADLWSCGIILYQMLFGGCPYGTCNIKVLLQQYSVKNQIRLPEQSRYLSPLITNMLKRMLCKDQFRRISWEEFYYQYSFTEQGQVKHKEKDFQYDLMKLMKKNQPVTEQKRGEGRAQPKPVRFDWSKITDINSSVNSQSCSNAEQQPTRQVSFGLSSQKLSRHQSQNFIPSHNNQLSYSCSLNTSAVSQQQVSSFYLMKKQLKLFQTQHQKILELLTITQNLLQSTKQYEYDSRIIYFLVYNVQFLLRTTIQDIKKYLNENAKMLEKYIEEKRKLQKLNMIFEKQYQQVILKINSIKTALLTLAQVGFQVFKYPKIGTLRKILKQYVQNFQLQAQNILSLTNDQHKEQAIKLLRIIWGVGLIFPEKGQNQVQNTTNKKKNSFNYTNTLSIKEQTTKKQVSAQLNRYLVRIGI